MPTTINSAGITFNDTTSLTSANIGTAQLVNGSVIAAKLGTTEQKQIAKAWVNFNGTTSPGTIRSSYNVSSVTKNATGDYTVNFASALADANYSANISSANTTVPDGPIVAIQSISTSSANVTVAGRQAGVANDSTLILFTVFGN
jgi:hypothetical protein